MSIVDMVVNYIVMDNMVVDSMVLGIVDFDIRMLVDYMVVDK